MTLHSALFSRWRGPSVSSGEAVSPCYLPMMPFPFQLSLSPHPAVHCWTPFPNPPPLQTPSVLGLSGGVGLSACCCDLDFKAEMVPGAVREYCSWPSLAGPPLGPSVWWHLGMQVSVPVSHQGFACPSVWLIVCLCHSACHQGRFVYSGPGRGLGMGTFGSIPLIV